MDLLTTTLDLVGAAGQALDEVSDLRRRLVEAPARELLDPAIPRRPGLYALYLRDGAWPVYVGMAAGRLGLQGRMAEHVGTLELHDGVSLMDVTCRVVVYARGAPLAHLEAALIRHFQPPWNSLVGFGSGRARKGLAPVGHWEEHYPRLAQPDTRPLRQVAESGSPYLAATSPDPHPAAAPAPALTVLHQPGRAVASDPALIPPAVSGVADVPLSILNRLSLCISHRARALTIHGDRACPASQGRHRRNERVVVVKPARLAAVLADLAAGRQSFSATLGTDDIWLDVALAHPAQTLGFAYVVHALLTTRYRRLKRAPLMIHCTAPPPTAHL